MSMYSGTAGSLNELLSALRFHAESEGWITHFAAPGQLITESPLAGHFSFQVQPGGETMELYGNRGYAPGQAPDQQPGRSSINTTEASTMATRFHPRHLGPYARYVAFVTTSYVHCVLEILDGIFGHLSFGMLDKRGEPASHGQYVQATYWAVQHASNAANWRGRLAGGFWQNFFEYPGRVFVGGIDNTPPINWGGVTTITGGLEVLHPDAGLVGASLSPQFSRRTPMPVRVLWNNNQGRRRILGQVPDFAVVNRKDMDAGDTIILGEDIWHVFPGYRVSADLGTGSAEIGFAYRTRSDQ